MEAFTLSVGPGDVLVLMVDAPVPDDVSKRLVQELRATLGQELRCIVLSSGMRLGVLKLEPS